jgi:hypothetical protein
MTYTVCPTRYRTRHWRYCNEIWTGVRSLCEKWRGMCPYCVSVVRLIVVTRNSGPPASGKIIKEMPASVASGTFYIIPTNTHTVCKYLNSITIWHILSYMCGLEWDILAENHVEKNSLWRYVGLKLPELLFRQIWLKKPHSIRNTKDT